MGVCGGKEEKKCTKFSKIYNDEESKNNYYENPKLQNKKQFNNKAIDISLYSNKVITKFIGEIQGKSIKLKSNINCIILIMENSESVSVENCKNCSILLAPCANTILVDNCENLNLISASLNLKIINVKKGNIYYFSINPLILKDCEDIILGNFFFQYTELPEMFLNSRLNIWNNKWSIYEEEGKNENISYSNDIIKQKIIDIFKPKLNNCYINIDQYQFLPFTYGRSLNYNDDEYINFMLIIRQEDFQENEILKLLLPDELDNINIKLIATKDVEKNSNKIADLIKNLELNKDTNFLIDYILRKDNKEELLESCQSSEMKFRGNKNRLSEIYFSNNEYMNNNAKFLKNGDSLFLWFVNCSEDFNQINYYFTNFFDPIEFEIIVKETFGWNEDEFKKYLNIFFEFNKSK